jgi:antitoxin component YwqK of YwqJK toxin-antitoxin module
MKYIFCLLFYSILITGFAQIQRNEVDCGMSDDYKKSTFKKYGKITTFNFLSTFYNENGILCYLGNPACKVTGFYGTWKGIDMYKRGRNAGRIVYYDECATRVKAVHLFYPKKNNGKIVHLEFYENGKKKSKTTTHNEKADRVITWDIKGKRKVENGEPKGRQY